MKYRLLILNLLLTLGGAGIVYLLIPDMKITYEQLILPPFAPPAIAFPIIWTILYIGMAIAATLVMSSSSDQRSLATLVYIRQLAVNFLWPVFFFYLKAYAFSFFWLLFLWFLIFYLLFLFYPIDPTAAYLMIPYLLWVSFASVLNICIYYLN